MQRTKSSGETSSSDTIDEKNVFLQKSPALSFASYCMTLDDVNLTGRKNGFAPNLHLANVSKFGKKI